MRPNYENFTRIVFPEYYERKISWRDEFIISEAKRKLPQFEKLDENKVTTECYYKNNDHTIQIVEYYYDKVMISVAIYQIGQPGYYMISTDEGKCLIVGDNYIVVDVDSGKILNEIDAVDYTDVDTLKVYSRENGTMIFDYDIRNKNIIWYDFFTGQRLMDL